LQDIEQKKTICYKIKQVPDRSEREARSKKRNARVPAFYTSPATMAIAAAARMDAIDTLMLTAAPINSSG
jgi:hypothetical protein